MQAHSPAPPHSRSRLAWVWGLHPLLGRSPRFVHGSTCNCIRLHSWRDRSCYQGACLYQLWLALQTNQRCDHQHPSPTLQSSCGRLGTDLRRIRWSALLRHCACVRRDTSFDYQSFSARPFLIDRSCDSKEGEQGSRQLMGEVSFVAISRSLLIRVTLTIWVVNQRVVHAL